MECTLNENSICLYDGNGISVATSNYDKNVSTDTQTVSKTIKIKFNMRLTKGDTYYVSYDVTNK